MATRQIRVCDCCGAVIPDNLDRYELQATIIRHTPSGRVKRAAGAQDLCSHQCATKVIASALNAVDVAPFETPA